MEIKEKVLDIDPKITVAVKQLLNIRGTNQKRFAKKLGVSYFVLNKFLMQKAYPIHSKNKHIYKVPYIRKAIADELGISYEVLWGEQGKDALNRIISEETTRLKIKKNSKTRFALGAGRKAGWSLKRFIKNLISLGDSGIYIYKEKRYEE